MPSRCIASQVEVKWPPPPSSIFKGGGKAQRNHRCDASGPGKGSPRGRGGKMRGVEVCLCVVVREDGRKGKGEYEKVSRKAE